VAGAMVLVVVDLGAGPAWSGERAEIERPLREHFGYVLGLQQQGKVLLAGPWAGAPGGMVLLQVADLAAAEQIMSVDPAIRAGVMSATLREWKPVDWDAAATRGLSFLEGPFTAAPKTP
jgi:uncharacterized protein YciI